MIFTPFTTGFPFGRVKNDCVKEMEKRYLKRKLIVNTFALNSKFKALKVLMEDDP